MFGFSVVGHRMVDGIYIIKLDINFLKYCCNSCKMDQLQSAILSTVHELVLYDFRNMTQDAFTELANVNTLSDIFDISEYDGGIGLLKK